MLARQVYEKAGAEAQARRRVEARLALALIRYRERGALLSKEDLDEWRLFQDSLEIDEPTRSLIKKSAESIKNKEQAERRRLYLFLAGLTVVASFAVWFALDARAQRRSLLRAQYVNIKKEAVAFEEKERFEEAIGKYEELMDEKYKEVIENDGAQKDNIDQKLRTLSDKSRDFEAYYRLVAEADSLFDRAIERGAADSEKHYCQALTNYMEASELLPEKKPLLEDKIKLTRRLKNTALNRLEKDIKVFAQLPDNQRWWEECREAWEILKNCRY